MYRVLAHHKNEYGEEAEIIVDVPGVVTLLGAYSDFCSGHAIMCTSTQGLRLAISRRSDNTVRVYNHTIQDRKRFQLSGLKCKPDDRWIGAIKAVFLSLLHDGVQLPGMNISITGRTAHSDYDTLSASVAAGFLIAFNEILKLNLSVSDMLRIAHSCNLYSNNQFRLRDLLTLFIIRRQELVFFDIESYDYKTLSNPFDENLSVYILDCGIPKNILSEEETKVKEETKQAMQNLKNARADVKLRDIVPRRLKYQRGLISEEGLRYANFTLTENLRAQSAWEALISKDPMKFAKAINEQQESISSDLELSSPEIDWLIKRNLENPKVLASTLIDTGLSGQIFILGEKGLKEEYRDKLDEYERIFDFHASIREFFPTGGVRILRDDEAL